MVKLIDLAGRRFGKFTVLSKAPSRIKACGTTTGYWNCVCDCGTILEVNTASLKGGHSKSCGCYLKEILSKRRKDTKDIAALKPEYRVWVDMIRRCTDIRVKAYIQYGAKGITVCQRWINSFWDFYHDMGDRPHQTSIDRIDNAKGYCPENCRWANSTQQAENRSSTIFVIHNGEKISLPALARKHGINPTTMRWRHKHNKPLVVT